MGNKVPNPRFSICRVPEDDPCTRKIDNLIFGTPHQKGKTRKNKHGPFFGERLGMASQMTDFGTTCNALASTSS